MSTTTLQFSFRVGGVLTNPTSVVLSDPTGVYGVKRTDTNAVIVPNATPMVLAQIGVYTYSLTAPDGVGISWWAKVLYNGVTSRFEREQTMPVSAAPSGWYGGMSDLIAVCGEGDLRNYSNVDSKNVETSGGFKNALAYDYTRIQQAMDAADAFINAFLKRYTPTPVAPTAVGFSLLSEAFGNYAVRRLYAARGGTADADESGTVIPNLRSNIWKAQYERLLNQYIESTLNTLPPGTFQSVPLEYEGGTTSNGIYGLGFGRDW